MQIDWWTLALQAVNFLVLVWLLRQFLYRPVQDVIAKRKALAEKAFADANQAKTEAEAARQQYEEARAGLAQERQEKLKALHEEMEAERRKLLEEAKRQAEEMQAAARDSLTKERDAALGEIRQQAAALATDLAARLLEKTGPGAAGAAGLDALERQLRDMPAEERARLQKDLATEGARLTVVTAAPLAPEDCKEWEGRLDAALERKGGTDFTADPDILGGAELRFPHAVLKFTWKDQLQKAEELLNRDDAAS